jgi:two-component system, LytTR family, response regulator
MEEKFDNKLKSVVFKTSLGFVYFDYSDIIMCSAEGNCTRVFTFKTSDPIKILHNISYLENKYCNDKFIRCHKSHIINLTYIEKLITKTHQVQLKGNYVVPLSDYYWKMIKKMSEMYTQSWGK